MNKGDLVELVIKEIKSTEKMLVFNKTYLVSKAQSSECLKWAEGETYMVEVTSSPNDYKQVWIKPSKQQAPAPKNTVSNNNSPVNGDEELRLRCFSAALSFNNGSRDEAEIVKIAEFIYAFVKGG